MWQKQQPGVRKLGGKFLWIFDSLGFFFFPLKLTYGNVCDLGFCALCLNLGWIGKIFSPETVWLRIGRKD